MGAIVQEGDVEAGDLQIALDRRGLRCSGQADLIQFSMPPDIVTDDADHTASLLILLDPPGQAQVIPRCSRSGTTFMASAPPPAAESLAHQLFDAREDAAAARAAGLRLWVVGGGGGRGVKVAVWR